MSLLRAQRLSVWLVRSGNPGPAGGGAVLLAAHGGRVAEAGVWLGHATNNEAEYTGLLAGLQLAIRCGVRRLLVEGGACAFSP